MDRNTVLAPPERETRKEQEPELAGPGTTPVPAPADVEEHLEAHNRAWFADALLELSDTRPRHRAVEIFLSVFIHSLFVGILLLIPLIFTDAIDLRQFTQTFLVAPPPPPPPPPAAPAITKVATAPRRVFMQAGKLVAPAVIPQKVAMIREDALPPDVGLGVVGGVPGGVPGGQAGGVIGGIISSSPRTFIPAPPTAAPKAPIRVGGRIREPRAVSRPEPIYPALAKQARLQGDVVIDAVIDVNGNVVEMQVVSGHPLLIPSALDALKRWRYQPTILNEEPVPVQLLVTIRFRLN